MTVLLNLLALEILCTKFPTNSYNTKTFDVSMAFVKGKINFKYGITYRSEKLCGSN